MKQSNPSILFMRPSSKIELFLILLGSLIIEKKVRVNERKILSHLLESFERPQSDLKNNTF
ncbi:hypothetical protein A6J42_17440 [Leptospira interrogans serovar Copenhageni]|nr:hypothetical protein A6J42_17440 [Leptospira interrogans serovar Copenhageni]